MALRSLMKGKELRAAQKKLEEARAKAEELEKREAELEADVEAAETDEEKAAVEEAVDAFETEKAETEKAVTDLEAEVDKLERELAEIEEKQPEAEAPAEGKREAATPQKEIRTMNKRWKEMTHEERSALVKRDGVQAWIGEIRSAIMEKRAITNVGLTIPQEVLPILKENVAEYSKLLKHVRLVSVSGEARQVIQGGIPEAVWTDCCANLNELSLTFYGTEVNCWKVAGFFALCNANIEDSDEDLIGDVLQALGQAIGLAVDKSILYGTGSRMPLGVVTRLVQTSKPAGYSDTDRPWVDLHTSNVKTIANSVTGAALIKAIITNAAAAKNKYTNSAKVWVMNEATHIKILGETINVDANGQLVAGASDKMPVVGGDIVELECVPDNMIVAGYFDLYLLGERAGAKFATSEHVRFLQDQTVFKGTARYDGVPVIAEAFVFIGIDGTSPAVSGVAFPQDKAQPIPAIALNAAAATVASGDTIQLYALITPGMGTVEWASGTVAKATVDSTGVVTGKASGSSIITATCDGLSASCTVTVTAE